LGGSREPATDNRLTTIARRRAVLDLKSVVRVRVPGLRLRLRESATTQSFADLSRTARSVNGDRGMFSDSGRPAHPSLFEDLKAGNYPV
jgi:hypothetical protein